MMQHRGLHHEVEAFVGKGQRERVAVDQMLGRHAVAVADLAQFAHRLDPDDMRVRHQRAQLAHRAPGAGAHVQDARRARQPDDADERGDGDGVLVVVGDMHGVIMFGGASIICPLLLDCVAHGSPCRRTWP